VAGERREHAVVGAERLEARRRRVPTRTRAPTSTTTALAAVLARTNSVCAMQQKIPALGQGIASRILGKKEWKPEGTFFRALPAGPKRMRADGELASTGHEAVLGAT